MSSFTRPTRGAEAHSKCVLAVCGVAHALHDGYTDMIYVLLPIWQAEFAVGYAALALLRGLYTGTMAVLQIPAASLAKRFGSRFILALGTALAAVGYALAGMSAGIIGLGVALALSGAGSSVQHPIASSEVAHAYGADARGPLGTYNFTGDLGKAVIPALASLLLTVVAWRGMLCFIALLGAGTAGVVAALLPATGQGNASEVTSNRPTGGEKGGFPLLFTIGVLDTAVRMGLLTFLPFLLKEKGASVPTVGFALALVFIGGAAGKFTCGWLGKRLGVLWTVLLTEGGTAAMILAVLALPLPLTLATLPLLGIMLNGTSSVLYGSVPEFAPADRTERAFAIFYTGTIGSGALAPILFGFVGDTLGIGWATVATAGTALATLPLAVVLSRRFRL